MDENRIIHIAANAGRIILENGGETYRVEETILRICKAFDVFDADSFVTPTGIMLSITTTSNQTISLVKRIHIRTVNLDKIDKVNDLSRTIVNSHLTLDEVETRLAEIDNLTTYSNKTGLICSALGAGFFTLLFKGTIKDFIVACLIGGAIKYVSILLSKIQLNSFFINIIGGAIATLIGAISVSLKLGDNFDKIVIGSIMLLVPGLMITNAVRDTIAGDLVSGSSRGIEALFIAIGIAIGVGIVLKIWFLYFGGINL